MLKTIQKYFFPTLIALVALTVSASAAFYSVSGLSKLFAGASLAVIIMASSLEVAKLVIASVLHQFRKVLPLLLKIYLSIALVVLVGITSMGIYGFLSSAYQKTYLESTQSETKIELLESQKTNINSQLISYNTEKESINESVESLREGLANNTIQYKDRETGQIITTTSTNNRKAYERQLDQALSRQDIINSKVDSFNTLLFNIDTKITEIKLEADASSELGPLKYLSSITNKPMDKIINVLLLIMIVVFDPLAIALVIVANFAFENVNKVKVKQKEIAKKIMEPAESHHSELIDGLLEEIEEEETNPQPKEPNKKQEILSNPNISSWKKRKLLKEEGLDEDDLTIKY